MVRKKYKDDLDQILATRHDNGADYWATPDGRIAVGGPFSTLEALLILSEIRAPKSHEAVRGAAKLVLTACGDDGRAHVAPKGPIYPCDTALAAAALCRHGYASRKPVKAMLEHLSSNRFEDGGWRCEKFFYGRGPETNFSNPGVTLFALDAFRAAGMTKGSSEFDRAVETLLDHWSVRIPTGPCHFGIGTLFMQVEYPFLRYNLFYYTYVLSFYSKARKDKRYREAFAALKAKLDNENRLIVERPNRKLAKLKFCKKSEPSELATLRYGEIVANLDGG